MWVMQTMILDASSAELPSRTPPLAGPALPAALPGPTRTGAVLNCQTNAPQQMHTYSFIVNKVPTHVEPTGTLHPKEVSFLTHNREASAPLNQQLAWVWIALAYFAADSKCFKEPVPCKALSLQGTGCPAKMPLRSSLKKNK
jgi:hypothetical protein